MTDNPLQVKKHPLGWYVDRITQGNHFALSRYGDGEFMAAMGRRGVNCDGHIMFAKMGEELKQALLNHLDDPSFIVATSPIARRTLGKEITQLLNGMGITLNCHHTGTFTDASINGELSPLIKALADKRVLYVAPQRLHKFATHHFAKDTITIPLTNCYLEKTSVVTQVHSMLDKGLYDVVCFSASMAANVMISDLWLLHRGSVTLLDLGSLFDYYATGVVTRSYMKNLTGKDSRLLHANFPRALYPVK